MKNNEKGITLVALVITIIVLLILAGVTIAALSGENGILKRASQSVVETKIADAKEMVTNAYNAAVAEYYNKKYVNGTGVADPASYVITAMSTDSDITGYKAVTFQVSTTAKTVTFNVDGTDYIGSIANSADNKGTTLSWNK